MRSHPTLQTIVASVFIVWIACAGPPPAEEPTAIAKPIVLGPGGSRPIAFLHVVQRMPAGTVLGVARWRGSSGVIDEIRSKGSSARSKSYNVAITDLLRAHGYTVRDEADAVFDAGREIRVRYQLAGVLHDVKVDYEYKRSRRYGIASEGIGTASVDLELQVYDVVRSESIFQRRYSGKGRDEGTEPQPIVPAVVDAVRAALADPDFVAVVAAQGPDSEVAASDASEFSSMERCPPHSGDAPLELNEMLESIVVVRVGGAVGAGVVVSRDGFVITAAHVVGEDDEVFVKLRSGPTLPARIATRNSVRDLALLELPGHDYPCASVADRSAVPIGSEIYAVNTLGRSEKPSVTRGVISGYEEVDGLRYIQTDASINLGSSGGPLFDQTGRVAGIVTQKVLGFGVEGLGFGVPIDDADEALKIRWR